MFLSYFIKLNYGQKHLLYLMKCSVVITYTLHCLAYHKGQTDISNTLGSSACSILSSSRLSCVKQSLAVLRQK